MNILYIILYLVLGLIVSVIGKIVLDEEELWNLTMIWLFWPFLLFGFVCFFCSLSIGSIPKWLAERIEKHLHKKDIKDDKEK